MKLPTWDELVRDAGQLEVLEVPLNKSVFVAGPPGSGKTVLAVTRARMVQDVPGTGTLALITYNRMLRRLVELLRDADSDIAQTMHSFVFTDPRLASVLGNTYDINWKKVLELLDGHPKGGHRWAHLVVDEGQDLPQPFFEYIARHGAPVLSIFADDDQALSDRRTTLEQIQAAAGLEDPWILTKNHRNSPEIAAVAEHFHTGRLPAATVQRAAIMERPQLVQSGGLQDTAELIARWYEARAGSIGVVVCSNDALTKLEKKLRGELSEARIDAYTNERKNEDAINVLLPGVTLVNKESVKGQEFDTVFVLELEQLLPCSTDIMRRAMYMLCTRARDYLMLVYGPESLSADAQACLPPASLLERR